MFSIRVLIVLFVAGVDSRRSDRCVAGVVERTILEEHRAPMTTPVTLVMIIIVLYGI